MYVSLLEQLDTDTVYWDKEDLGGITLCIIHMCAYVWNMISQSF